MQGRTEEGPDAGQRPCDQRGDPSVLDARACERDEGTRAEQPDAQRRGADDGALDGRGGPREAREVEDDEGEERENEGVGEGEEKESRGHGGRLVEGAEGASRVPDAAPAWTMSAS